MSWWDIISQRGNLEISDSFKECHNNKKGLWGLRLRKERIIFAWVDNLNMSVSTVNMSWLLSQEVQAIFVWGPFFVKFFFSRCFTLFYFTSHSIFYLIICFLKLLLPFIPCISGFVKYITGEWLPLARTCVHLHCRLNKRGAEHLEWNTCRTGMKKPPMFLLHIAWEVQVAMDGWWTSL
jgi:hypothetical protein